MIQDELTTQNHNKHASKKRKTHSLYRRCRWRWCDL